MARYTIAIIRNPQNSIGNYLGTYIIAGPAVRSHTAHSSRRPRKRQRRAKASNPTTPTRRELLLGVLLVGSYDFNFWGFYMNYK